MFMQVIRAQVADRAAARALLDRWAEDVRPGAIGFLGSTGGITDEGELVTVARFESAESARANSDRPEQGAWWEEFSKALDGEATFAECSDARLGFGGGSDDAGFVQVIQGRVLDAEALRRGVEGWEGLGTAGMGRPDVLGMVYGIHDEGGEFTQVVYFTNEQEARTGEGAEPPEQARELDEQMEQASGDLRYYDLRHDLWLVSA